MKDSLADLTLAWVLVVILGYFLLAKTPALWINLFGVLVMLFGILGLMVIGQFRGPNRP